MTPHANEVPVVWAGLLLLVVLGAVTITAIILLARRRWGRVVLASTSLAALFLGLFIYMRAGSVHHVQQQPAQTHAEMETARRSDQSTMDRHRHGSTSTAAAVRWDVDLEKKFEPDVYSAKRLALAGMARKLIDEAFQANLRDDQDADQPLLESPGHVPAHERVTLTVYTDNPALFETLKPLARSDPRLGEIRLKPAHEVAARDDRRMAIAFHKPQTVSTGDGEFKELTGFVLYRRGEIEKTVRFADWPWLTKLNETDGNFSMVRDGDILQIVTTSRALTGDRTATYEEALDAAQHMVQSRVVERIRGSRSYGDWGSVTLPRRLTDLIRRVIEEGYRGEFQQHTLRTGPLLRESFTQRFEREYGPVYRTAVRVDVPDGLVDILARIGMQHQQNLRQTWIVKGVSLAAMFLLIVLTYAFLNAATKGYFRAWLIGGSLAVLVAGMCVVLFVA